MPRAMSPKNTPKADDNIMIRLTMGQLKALISTEVKKQFEEITGEDVTKQQLSSIEVELKSVKAELKSMKAELKEVSDRLEIMERRLDHFDLVVFALLEASLAERTA